MLKGIIIQTLSTLRRRLFPANNFERMINSRGIAYAVEIFSTVLTDDDWEKLTMDQLYVLLCHHDNQKARDLYMFRIKNSLEQVMSIRQCQSLYKSNGERVWQTGTLFCERALMLAKVSENLLWVYDISRGPEFSEINTRILEKMLALAKNEKETQLVYDRAKGELKVRAFRKLRNCLSI